MGEKINKKESFVKISIIIPVFNAMPYLVETLESVREAIKDLSAEVICVDDGSDDGCEKVLDAYADENPAFVVKHRDHLGAGAARNYGVSKAIGKYLAFVDSDDIIPDNLYKDMLYLCESNHVNLCISNITRFEGKNKGVVSGQYQRAFSGEPNYLTSIDKSMSFIYDGASWNKLILRQFWEEHRFSFPEIGHYEDMPVFLKLFCTVGRFAVLQSFGYYWRITPGGNSISQQVERVETLEDRMNVCADMLNYLRNRYGENSDIAKFMEDRLLRWEFDSNLWHFEKLDKNTRTLFCEKLRDFYQTTIKTVSISSLPLFHQKRYEYIMNVEPDQLVRLMNHRRMGWRTAPIEEKGNRYYLKLPEDIYGQEYANAAVELQDDIPVTKITRVIQNGNKVSMNIVVYQPRVNTAEKDSQFIKAFLYNEHTGMRIYLPCVPLKVEPWTKTYGTVISNDDYRVYQYNYDWAGITLTIDFEDISRQDVDSKAILEKGLGIKPRWMLFVEYHTPVLDGVRPVRGILPKVRTEISDLQIVVGNEDKYKYEFVQSIRESLYIEMKKLGGSRRRRLPFYKK